jgi:hypothetical protein
VDALRLDASLLDCALVALNLWAGIAMVVFAGAFALWSRLRPVVVEERPAEDGDRPAH